MQHGGIHALDAAGSLVIDAVQNAGRVCGQSIGDGAAQIGGRQPFEQFMRHAVGGQQSDAQCLVIGDAGAVEIAGRHVESVGQAGDLMGRPVNESDADAQAAQQGDVEQQIAKVFVLNHGAVEGNNEHAVAEARHIAEDFA